MLERQLFCTSSKLENLSKPLLLWVIYVVIISLFCEYISMYTVAIAYCMVMDFMAINSKCLRIGHSHQG